MQWKAQGVVRTSRPFPQCLGNSSAMTLANPCLNWVSTADGTDAKRCNTSLFIHGFAIVADADGLGVLHQQA